MVVYKRIVAIFCDLDKESPCAKQGCNFTRYLKFVKTKL